jgi:uncharacterized protein (TIGR02452 family)
MALVRNVVIFRDENRRLLDEPFTAAFLIACAPPAGMEPEGLADPMDQCVDRIIEVAQHSKAKELILGAIGCGNCGHAPAKVAARFKYALVDQRLRGYFDRVVFAIPPTTHGVDAFAAFTEVFAGY